MTSIDAHHGLEIVRLESLHGSEKLAEEAAAEGYDTFERFVREWNEGIEVYNGHAEAMFGVYLAGELIATGGVLRVNNRVCRLRRVYVSPRYRRKGIARILTRRLLDFASAYYSVALLYTDSENAAAMYEALGFVSQPPDGPDRASHRFEFQKPATSDRRS